MISWCIFSPFPPGQAGTQRGEESRAAPVPPQGSLGCIRPGRVPRRGGRTPLPPAPHPPGFPALLPASVSPLPFPTLLSNSLLLPFSATLVKASPSEAADRVTKDNLAASLPALHALFSQPWLPPRLAPLSPGARPCPFSPPFWLGSLLHDRTRAQQEVIRPCFGPGAFPLQPTLHPCRQALAQHFLTATQPHPPLLLSYFFISLCCVWQPAFSQTRGLFCMHKAPCLACLTIQPDRMIH